MCKQLIVSILLFFALSTVAFAQSGTSVADAESQIRKIFPNFAIEAVSASPIPGVYEVVSQNGQIIYWSPEGYVIFGEIWTTTGESITAQRQAKVAFRKALDLDYSQAIKIGNGKVKIVTFVDPECPFCKEGYKFLSNQKNVTEYVFFLLRGETSFKKAAYVVCSKDKETAYRMIMSGSAKDITVSNECMEKAKEVFSKHFLMARTFGVSAVPTYFVEEKRIQGANVSQLKNAIEEKLNK